MCDEYYDARMKAFWRALAEDSELEEETDQGIVERIVLQPIEPVKPRPKALAR